MKRIVGFTFIAFCLTLLTGCTGPRTDALELSNVKPTLVFFYTEFWGQWEIMESIVNGLEEEYGQRVDFMALNAEDGDQGEQAFVQYGLRGHPTIVLILPNGEISWIGSGVSTREAIEQELLAALD